MAIFNPLPWHNENALSSYPFLSDLEVQDFIVDASFVQFDNFIPVLNYFTVNNSNITLAITFDYGQTTGIVLSKNQFSSGNTTSFIRLHNPTTERYLGTLTFGPGANTLWEGYEGQKVIVEKSFVAETVRSIPSKDAVYTFDGNYGDVTLSRTSEDETVFYNTHLDLNSITFNAVTGHAINPGIKEGLRKINLVPPLNNNINLASNDVIKITPNNNTSLTISLVSGNSSAAFSLPTLIS